MIPKVANHFFTSTARATYAFKNALQIQPSTGLGGWSGSGSSSYGGGSGAGAGGAKYNSSSRFYHGYNSAGRAVSQSSSSNDGQFDDSDELQLKPSSTRRPRARSTSLAPARANRPELGVLQAVKAHVRSKHTFSRASSRPRQVRRNSTSAIHELPAPELEDELITPPASALRAPSPPPVTTDPAAPQTVLAPQFEDDIPFADEPSEPPNDGEGASIRSRIHAAALNHDSSKVLGLVRQLSSMPDATVGCYNAALYSLKHIRKPGQALTKMLEVYNEMISRGLSPSNRTYYVLIVTLTERDVEIFRAIDTLEARIRRRSTFGRDAELTETDTRRIEQLRAEPNFNSAMALFASLTATSRSNVDVELYTHLLRSCSIHCNIDAAIQVYAHLEKQRATLPTAVVFYHLMNTYVKAGDYDGAKEIFEEFRRVSARGQVSWHMPRRNGPSQLDEFASLTDGNRPGYARMHQIRMWNLMIETYMCAGDHPAAIAVLEQMMDSKAGPAFGEADIPPPAPSTFTRIITGFCKAGDIQTALSWFERLLRHKAPPVHPFMSSSEGTRPDYVCWTVILNHLAEAGLIDDLSRLFISQKETAPRDGFALNRADYAMIGVACLQYVDTHPELSNADALVRLDWIRDNVLTEDSELRSAQMTQLVNPLIRLYLRHDARNRALDESERLVQRVLATTTATELESDAMETQRSIQDARFFMKVNTPLLLGIDARESVDWAVARKVMLLNWSLGLPLGGEYAAWIVRAYFQERPQSANSMNDSDWEPLLRCTTSLELPAESVSLPSDLEVGGTDGVLEDMSRREVRLVQMKASCIQRVCTVLELKFGQAGYTEFAQKLGPSIRDRLLTKQSNRMAPTKFIMGTAPAEFQSESPSVAQGPNYVDVDTYHSNFVGEFWPSHKTVTPLIAYQRFKTGLKTNKFPTTDVLSRLINALGRLKEMDKLYEAYDAAQNVMSALWQERGEQWRTVAWFGVEDSMIIGLAHAGNYDGAYMHRNRILEHGGSPSSDAYGALIMAIKDTTDDTASAMQLYQEARSNGVVPNTYLYNTIISKLAKARKADYALELFQEMRASSVARPTSVTYGAIIAACCRVGDVASAEMLFQEMSEQPNFKPRVPPYNTMMQLYTHIKPDRERALHYYNALLATNTPPSGHTYKLLLDAHGTIEPMDAAAMEQVFATIVNDRRVRVEGTHWSALINAYGCVQKDLDKAIQVFESIATHPSSQNRSDRQPDALAVEALFNVFVSLKRQDLIPTYINRIQELGLHMTAYIANLVIRGYAAAGKLDAAREFFEGMLDPPQGMAAPDNHVPHDGTAPRAISNDAPIYREPSTWEAMVRAELGHGNRDNAVALLQRMQDRQYPTAVCNRVSGIMLDDNVSPWPASPTSTDSHS